MLFTCAFLLLLPPWPGRMLRSAMKASSDTSGGSSSLNSRVDHSAAKLVADPSDLPPATVLVDLLYSNLLSSPPFLGTSEGGQRGAGSSPDLDFRTLSDDIGSEAWRRNIASTVKLDSKLRDLTRNVDFSDKLRLRSLYIKHFGLNLSRLKGFEILGCPPLDEKSEKKNLVTSLLILAVGLEKEDALKFSEALLTVSPEIVHDYFGLSQEELSWRISKVIDKATPSLYGTMLSVEGMSLPVEEAPKVEVYLEAMNSFLPARPISVIDFVSLETQETLNQFGRTLINDASGSPRSVGVLYPLSLGETTNFVVLRPSSPSASPFSTPRLHTSPISTGFVSPSPGSEVKSAVVKFEDVIFYLSQHDMNFFVAGLLLHGARDVLRCFNPILLSMHACRDEGDRLDEFISVFIDIHKEDLFIDFHGLLDRLLNLEKKLSDSGIPELSTLAQIVISSFADLHKEFTRSGLSPESRSLYKTELELLSERVSNSLDLLVNRFLTDEQLKKVERDTGESCMLGLYGSDEGAEAWTPTPSQGRQARLPSASQSLQSAVQSALAEPEPPVDIQDILPVVKEETSTLWGGAFLAKLSTTVSGLDLGSEVEKSKQLVSAKARSLTEDSCCCVARKVDGEEDPLENARHAISRHSKSEKCSTAEKCGKEATEGAFESVKVAVLVEVDNPSAPTGRKKDGSPFVSTQTFRSTLTNALQALKQIGFESEVNSLLRLSAGAFEGAMLDYLGLFQYMNKLEQTPQVHSLVPFVHLKRLMKAAAVQYLKSGLRNKEPDQQIKELALLASVVTDAPQDPLRDLMREIQSLYEKVQSTLPGAQGAREGLTGEVLESSVLKKTVGSLIADALREETMENVRRALQKVNHVKREVEQNMRDVNSLEDAEKLIVKVIKPPEEDATLIPVSPFQGSVSEFFDIFTAMDTKDGEYLRRKRGMDLHISFQKELPQLVNLLAAAVKAFEKVDSEKRNATFFRTVWLIFSRYTKVLVKLKYPEGGHKLELALKTALRMRIRFCSSSDRASLRLLGNRVLAFLLALTGFAHELGNAEGMQDAGLRKEAMYSLILPRSNKWEMASTYYFDSVVEQSPLFLSLEKSLGGKLPALEAIYKKAFDHTRPILDFSGLPCLESFKVERLVVGSSYLFTVSATTGTSRMGELFNSLHGVLSQSSSSALSGYFEDLLIATALEMHQKSSFDESNDRTNIFANTQKVVGSSLFLRAANALGKRLAASKGNFDYFLGSFLQANLGVDFYRQLLGSAIKASSHIYVSREVRSISAEVTPLLVESLQPCQAQLKHVLDEMISFLLIDGEGEDRLKGSSTLPYLEAIRTWVVTLLSIGTFHAEERVLDVSFCALGLNKSPTSFVYDDLFFFDFQDCVLEVLGEIRRFPPSLAPKFSPESLEITRATMTLLGTTYSSPSKLDSTGDVKDEFLANLNYRFGETCRLLGGSPVSPDAAVTRDQVQMHLAEAKRYSDALVVKHFDRNVVDMQRAAFHVLAWRSLKSPCEFLDHFKTFSYRELLHVLRKDPVELYEDYFFGEEQGSEQDSTKLQIWNHKVSSLVACVLHPAWISSDWSNLRLLKVCPAAYLQLKKMVADLLRLRMDFASFFPQEWSTLVFEEVVIPALSRRQLRGSVKLSLNGEEPFDFLRVSWELYILSRQNPVFTLKRLSGFQKMLDEMRYSDYLETRISAAFEFFSTLSRETFNLETLVSNSDVPEKAELAKLCLWILPRSASASPQLRKLIQGVREATEKLISSLMSITESRETDFSELLDSLEVLHLGQQLVLRRYMNPDSSASTYVSIKVIGIGDNSIREARATPSRETFKNALQVHWFIEEMLKANEENLKEDNAISLSDFFRYLPFRCVAEDHPPSRLSSLSPTLSRVNFLGFPSARSCLCRTRRKSAPSQKLEDVDVGISVDESCFSNADGEDTPPTQNPLSPFLGFIKMGLSSPSSKSFSLVSTRHASRSRFGMSPTASVELPTPEFSSTFFKVLLQGLLSPLEFALAFSVGLDEAWDIMNLETQLVGLESRLLTAHIQKFMKQLFPVLFTCLENLPETEERSFLADLLTGDTLSSDSTLLDEYADRVGTWLSNQGIPACQNKALLKVSVEVKQKYLILRSVAASSPGGLDIWLRLVDWISSHYGGTSTVQDLRMLARLLNYSRAFKDLESAFNFFIESFDQIIASGNQNFVLKRVLLNAINGRVVETGKAPPIIPCTLPITFLENEGKLTLDILAELLKTILSITTFTSENTFYICSVFDVWMQSEFHEMSAMNEDTLEKIKRYSEQGGQELRAWLTKLTTLYVQNLLGIPPSSLGFDVASTLAEFLENTNLVLSESLVAELGTKADIQLLQIQEMLDMFKSHSWLLQDSTVAIMQSSPANQWIPKMRTQFSSSEEISQDRLVAELRILLEESTENKGQNMLTRYIGALESAHPGGPEGVGGVSLESDLSMLSELLALSPQANAEGRPTFGWAISEGDRIFNAYTSYQTEAKTPKSSSPFEPPQWIRSKPIPILRVLSVLCRLVYLSPEMSKEGTAPFYPNAAQRAAVLLNTYGNGINKMNVLGNVETGEGKSIIMMMSAILINLSTGLKVDVLTSAETLSLRDAKKAMRISEMMGLKVGVNCDLKADENEEVRKLRYKESDIMFGDMGRFQRDYLITMYGEGRNDEKHPKHLFPPSRTIAATRSLLLDECDMALIDKGVETLYLSHSILIFSRLRHVFVSIWAVVSQSAKVGLNLPYDLLREIIEADLVSPRRSYPAMLNSFIDSRMEKWIDSAKLALTLSEGVEYVLIDEKPVIVDLISGIEQYKTRWGSGLHQFIELKHFSKIHDETLKSIYISHIGFVSLYKNFVGMSGTLDSNSVSLISEIPHLSSKKASLGYYRLPRSKKSQVTKERGLVFTNEFAWVEGVVRDVLEKVRPAPELGRLPRAVLVICKDISDLNKVLDALVKTSLKTIFVYKGLNSGICKTENGVIVKSKIKDSEFGKVEPGSIIVSTNVAGRGLDLLTSDALEEAGGLHVVLSSIPPRRSTELQGAGRTGRKGRKGTYRFIVLFEGEGYHSELGDDTFINDLLLQRDVSERFKIRDQTFMHYKKIQMEEKLLHEYAAIPQPVVDSDLALLPGKSGSDDRLDEVLTLIQTLRRKSMADRWAIWLDSMAPKIEEMSKTRDSSYEERLTAEILSEFASFRESVSDYSEKDVVHVLLTNRNDKEVSVPFETFEIGGLLYVVELLLQQSKYKDAYKACSLMVDLEPRLSAFAYAYRATASLGIDKYKGGRQNAEEDVRRAIALLEEEKERVQRFPGLIGVSGKSASSSYMASVQTELKILEVHLQKLKTVLGHGLSAEDFQVDALLGRGDAGDDGEAKFWEKFSEHPQIMQKVLKPEAIKDEVQVRWMLTWTSQTQKISKSKAVARLWMDYQRKFLSEVGIKGKVYIPDYSLRMAMREALPQASWSLEQRGPREELLELSLVVDAETVFLCLARALSSSPIQSFIQSRHVEYVALPEAFTPLDVAAATHDYVLDSEDGKDASLEIFLKSSFQGREKKETLDFVPFPEELASIQGDVIARLVVARDAYSFAVKDKEVKDNLSWIVSGSSSLPDSLPSSLPDSFPSSLSDSFPDSFVSSLPDSFPSSLPSSSPSHPSAAKATPKTPPEALAQDLRSLIAPRSEVVKLLRKSPEFSMRLRVKFPYSLDLLEELFKDEEWWPEEGKGAFFIESPRSSKSTDTSSGPYSLPYSIPYQRIYSDVKVMGRKYTVFVRTEIYWKDLTGKASCVRLSPTPSEKEVTPTKKLLNKLQVTFPLSRLDTCDSVDIADFDIKPIVQMYEKNFKVDNDLIDFLPPSSRVLEEDAFLIPTPQFREKVRGFWVESKISVVPSLSATFLPSTGKSDQASRVRDLIESEDPTSFLPSDQTGMVRELVGREVPSFTSFLPVCCGGPKKSRRLSEEEVKVLEGFLLSLDPGKPIQRRKFEAELRNVLPVALDSEEKTKMFYSGLIDLFVNSRKLFTLSPRFFLSDNVRRLISLWTSRVKPLVRELSPMEMRSLRALFIAEPQLSDPSLVEKVTEAIQSSLNPAVSRANTGLITPDTLGVSSEVFKVIFGVLLKLDLIDTDLKEDILCLPSRVPLTSVSILELYIMEIFPEEALEIISIDRLMKSIATPPRVNLKIQDFARNSDILDEAIERHVTKALKELHPKQQTKVGAHVLKVLREAAGELRTLGQPVFQRETLSKLFKDGSDPLPLEVVEYIERAQNFILSISEERVHLDPRSAGVVCLGLAQVTVGAFILALGGPTAFIAGSFFVNEGKNDIVSGARFMYDGNFNWKSYKQSKMMSAALTLTGSVATGGLLTNLGFLDVDVQNFWSTFGPSMISFSWEAVDIMLFSRLSAATIQCMDMLLKKTVKESVGKAMTLYTSSMRALDAAIQNILDLYGQEGILMVAQAIKDVCEEDSGDVESFTPSGTGISKEKIFQVLGSGMDVVTSTAKDTLDLVYSATKSRHVKTAAFISDRLTHAIKISKIAISVVALTRLKIRMLTTHLNELQHTQRPGDVVSVPPGEYKKIREHLNEVLKSTLADEILGKVKTRSSFYLLKEEMEVQANAMTMRFQKNLEDHGAGVASDLFRKYELLKSTEMSTEREVAALSFHDPVKALDPPRLPRDLVVNIRGERRKLEEVFKLAQFADNDKAPKLVFVEKGSDLTLWVPPYADYVESLGDSKKKSGYFDAVAMAFSQGIGLEIVEKDLNSQDLLYKPFPSAGFTRVSVFPNQAGGFSFRPRMLGRYNPENPANAAEAILFTNGVSDVSEAIAPLLEDAQETALSSHILYNLYTFGSTGQEGSKAVLSAPIQNKMKLSSKQASSRQGAHSPGGKRSH